MTGAALLGSCSAEVSSCGALLQPALCKAGLQGSSYQAHAHVASGQQQHKAAMGPHLQLQGCLLRPAAAAFFVGLALFEMLAAQQEQQSSS